MPLSEEFKNEHAIDVARLRRERDAAVHEAANVREQLDNALRALNVVERTEQGTIDPPKWLMPNAPKQKAATLVVMLSDTHFDEVVNPDEVDGLNAYNRAIAELRLERWTQNVIKLSRHYLSGMKYDGCVILLGGDIFSGDIHEELSETNEDTMMSSCWYWSGRIAAAIDVLAQEFKNVHVASVVGNHGRTTRKPRAKLRAKTNFDWLLTKVVERHFQDNEKITFSIPDGADCYLTIYSHGHLLTHGDQVSGGGGIGGIYPPIMRLRARKAQRHHSTGTNFETLWLGHWHQYLPSPSLVVNGSLKGWDEYAAISNFQFEVPQQALAIVTPEHNITIQSPVFCVDRKREGW